MKKFCTIVFLGMIFCNGALHPLTLLPSKKSPEEVYEKKKAAWEERQEMYDAKRSNIRKQIEAKKSELDKAIEEAEKKEEDITNTADKKEFVAMHERIQKLREGLGKLRCSLAKAEYVRYSKKGLFGGKVKFGKGKYMQYIKALADLRIKEASSEEEEEEE